MPLTRESMALDAIRDVGPGGEFLTNDHTLDYYRENWMPGVTDRNIYERWAELGATTMEERCKAKIQAILSGPIIAYNEPAIDAVLKGIVNE
jgi:trimethylamine--corrinoid protein Co-methyltransferase